ncbi:MAG: S8 family serine peptidase [Flavobacterium sp.]|uniref:S8 family serine peptidase n=1 Tax=Flavobacterium sp. TaxID=239 RepID=UPI003BEACBEB
MKTVLFVILCSVTVFSQTAKEREKIQSFSDPKMVDLVRQELSMFKSEQDLLIHLYKSKYGFVNSERKSLQRFINGEPIFYTIDNAGSAITIGGSTMYPSGSLGLNVTGSGMTAGVWDGGKVRFSHQELVGKITLGDSQTSLSDHSTHVTGTMVAAGVSASRRGLAYNASAKTYGWEDDTIEMETFASDGYLVSNHSYGYVASNLTNALFGKYDSTSRQMDLIAVAHPYYQIVAAAGNDRTDSAVAQLDLKNGYDMLTGMSNSKNGISVAAVEEVPEYFDASSVTMSSFSNFGPPDDGRVKPDISAKGVNVSSCIATNNTAYASFQGTSMAAPGLAGLIVLLQKHYNNLNTGSFMRASTVRGLLCHTAKEAGFEAGPDYEFGWGLANGEESAQLIIQKGTTAILEENTLVSGQVFVKSITLNNPQKLKVSICWTDPSAPVNINTAEDNRNPVLINNLDLKVFKDGAPYYPWKLNPSDPTAIATNVSDNNVDNIEKVEIENAPAGVYTIQVSHKGSSLSGGSQVFSLIANGTTGLNLNTRDYDYDNSIFIYPNPASNVLNFSTKNNIEISSVIINDISGKEVYNRKNTLSQNQIDISNLSGGVYFVTFNSDGKSVTKKFLKE